MKRITKKQIEKNFDLIINGKYGNYNVTQIGKNGFYPKGQFANLSEIFEYFNQEHNETNAWLALA